MLGCLRKIVFNEIDFLVKFRFKENCKYKKFTHTHYPVFAIISILHWNITFVSINNNNIN